MVSADGAAGRDALEPPSPQNWVQPQREQQQQQQARAKEEEEQRLRETRQRLVRKMQEEEREMQRQQQQSAGRWEEFLTQNLSAAASTESADPGPAAQVFVRATPASPTSCVLMCARGTCGLRHALPTWDGVF